MSSDEKHIQKYHPNIEPPNTSKGPTPTEVPPREITLAPGGTSMKEAQPITATTSPTHSSFELDQPLQLRCKWV